MRRWKQSKGSPTCRQPSQIPKVSHSFPRWPMPEAVREKASARCSTLVQSTPTIRIKIGETEIEVPEGLESKHLEMVLKAVQNAR